MVLEFSDLPVICAAVLISGFIHGSVGFGSGLIAVGLLGHFVGIRDASVVVTLPALVLTVVMWWRLRAHASLRRTVPLILAAFIGVNLGLGFLFGAPKRALEVMAGVLMIATAVYGAMPGWSGKRWHPVWLGVPCGLLSGLMSGAYASGGPPVVAFLSTQRYDRLRFVASLQVTFVLLCLFRVGHLCRRGAMTGTVLFYSACACLVMIGGSFLGTLLLKRMSDRIMRRAVLLVLFVLGVLYLAW